MATTQDDRPSRQSDGDVLAVLGLDESPQGTYLVALTHRSFAFESEGEVEHNERLEFLGDAILGAVVTDTIFTRYPQLAEGEMARLRASVVNTNALADLARTIGLGEVMRLGKGEEASGGRDKDSLLANVFEAVVGATYVERGADGVRDVFGALLGDRIDEAMAAPERYDAKTALQEKAVRDVSELPSYRLAASGPDHDRRYTAHVFIRNRLMGEGEGRSKKEAEQNAARAALQKIGESAGAGTG